MTVQPMTERDDDDIRRTLTVWFDELAAKLDSTGAPADIDQILAIAGTAAHAVLRPAAPLTTYLLGYAAGKAENDPAGDPAEAFQRAAAIARATAAERSLDHRE